MIVVGWGATYFGAQVGSDTLMKTPGLRYCIRMYSFQLIIMKSKAKSVLKSRRLECCFGKRVCGNAEGGIPV